MRVSPWWALWNSRTNNVHVKIKGFFIQARQTILSLIDSQRVMVPLVIQFKCVLFDNHSQERSCETSLIEHACMLQVKIIFKNYVFCTKETVCMCLISEGQLEAFLQNVVRQAQDSAEIRDLSQQLDSVSVWGWITGFVFNDSFWRPDLAYLCYVAPRSV